MRKYTFIRVVLLTFVFLLLVGQAAFAQPAVSLNTTANEGYVHLDWTLSVDTSVYSITYFNIYRSNTVDFIANDQSLLVEVYNAGLRSYDDYSITANQAVYYQIRVIDAVYGPIAISGESNTAANASKPHGYYNSKTTKCSICHATHEGSGPGLVNTQLNTMDDLCKICHENGGISSLIISKPMANATLQSCNTCHNPHGNNVNREFVPSLLQVTIGGKVYFSATDLQNGVGDGFCLVPACHSPAKYPSIMDVTYRPANNPHGDNAMVDNQLQAGQTNDTKISCNACHSKHESDTSMYIRKQVYWDDKAYDFTEDIIDNAGYPITEKYNNFCLSCHENAKELWTGKTAYNDNTKNGHSNKPCSSCHDPHGKDGRGKYLIDKYAFDNSVIDTPDNSFQLCFACHNKAETVLENSYFSGTYDGQVVNLHTFHLQDVADGQRALCSDCHNPHGINAAENPDGIRNIGFLNAYPLGSTYLKANAYETPRFIDNSLSLDTPNRACSLTCHGVKHSESVTDGVYAVYQSGSAAPAVINTIIEPESITDKVYDGISSAINDVVQVVYSVYQAIY